MSLLVEGTLPGLQHRNSGGATAGIGALLNWAQPPLQNKAAHQTVTRQGHTEVNLKTDRLAPCVEKQYVAVLTARCILAT